MFLPKFTVGGDRRTASTIVKQVFRRRALNLGRMLRPSRSFADPAQ